MNDLQHDTCTDYSVQWAGPFSSEIPENTPTPALRSPYSSSPMGVLQEVMVVKTSAFQLHLSTRLPHWLLHTHVSLRYDEHSTVTRVIRYLKVLFLGTNYCYSTGSGNEDRLLVCCAGTIGYILL